MQCTLTGKTSGFVPLPGITGMGKIPEKHNRSYAAEI
jgi:hypothetical protein